MKNLQKHRNIGISAHIDSGKTTLTERILYYSGRIHRMQEVKGKDGGATMDSMDLERERGITIASAATSVAWMDHSINVIDTPGHVDFTVEVERSLRVLDGAILVLCAVGGVQSQSLTVDRQMRRYHVPRIAFINKMDRIGANPDNVMKQMADKLHVTPLPLQLPMGREEAFEGVIDLITMQAVYFDGPMGETIRREAIPAKYQEAAAEARNHMLETLSLYSDELMMALLEETEVSEADIRSLVREATLAHHIVPVLMGTAFRNKGVQEALDAVVQYLPNPLDRELTAIDVSKQKPGAETPPDEIRRVPLTSSDDLPLVAMAFKTVVEAFGQLTYFRIYQGQIKKGDSYTNTRTGRKVRFGRLVRMHADDREDIDQAGAGDIIAVVGVDCASGRHVLRRWRGLLPRKHFRAGAGDSSVHRTVETRWSGQAQQSARTLPPGRSHVPSHQRPGNQSNHHRRDGAVASRYLYRTHPPGIRRGMLRRRAEGGVSRMSHQSRRFRLPPQKAIGRFRSVRPHQRPD